MPRGWLVQLPNFHALPRPELRVRLRFSAQLDSLPESLHKGDRVVGWRDSQGAAGRCIVAEGTVEAIEQGPPAKVHVVGPALRARWDCKALMSAGLAELVLMDSHGAKPVDLTTIDLLRQTDAASPVARYVPSSDSPGAQRKAEEAREMQERNLRERQKAKQRQRRKKGRKSRSVWTVSGGSGPYIPGRGKNW